MQMQKTRTTNALATTAITAATTDGATRAAGIGVLVNVDTAAQTQRSRTPSKPWGVPWWSQQQQQEQQQRQSRTRWRPLCHSCC
jgi:hypothetical protein